MNKNNYVNRVLAIDLLRAIAVALMLEGHTTHVFLQTELRDPANIAFSTWQWIRGFTAPLFMFVSGLVFTFLLFDENFSLKEERLKKGIRRGMFLIFLGYLLRFPSFNPYYLARISEEQIRTFISVDALHIIGFGLLAISFFAFVLNYLKTGAFASRFFSVVSLIFFFAGAFTDNFTFAQKLPDFLAAWFVNDYGSIFTLFPWLGYLFLGASFSFIFRRNNSRAKKRGLLFALPAFIVFAAIEKFTGETYFLIIAERTTFVMALLGIAILITDKFKKLPSGILALGKNTLTVYVAHLVILYGSPVSIGFYQTMPASLTLFQTVLAVLLMETIMFYIAVLKEKNRENKSETGRVYVASR